MSQPTENIEQLSPLQRAFVTIKEMRSKLDTWENRAHEPIAIIGMSCRFPGGANDPESFWQILRDGIDTVKEVPPERWNIEDYYDPHPETPNKTNVRQGGFLDCKVDEFDADFFGLHPREVTSMDPQQRFLLEVSWEALENAGIAPDKLTGSPTGVFVGISVNEYGQLAINNNDDIDVYAATGNVASVAAGRLSHKLGLQGPSIALDTSCSSSLVGVHLACASLRSGECNLALAGGVILMLSPSSTIAMSKLGALSADGRCKTFDARADGYGRGEGCGIVILKRLSDALKDGDNILAVVKGSAVNQDGPSSGLTVPNGQAQRAVIRAALQNAKVEPDDISYIEAHGTGTSLGDPIEVRALGSIFGKRPPEVEPLIVGSVKTNIGHMEPAAGIGGLIKVVLAMQHGEIPPHLHLNNLNSHISEARVPINIPTKLTPWLPGKTGEVLAGVSSFGFSGTNSHVILESVKVKRQKAKGKSENLFERPLHLLTLSAKTDTALKELKNRYQKYLETHVGRFHGTSLPDICFTANAGRCHFSHRLALVAESLEEITKQLANLGDTEKPIDDSPEVVFLFTGQDSQYVNIGRQLFQTQPTFRKILERCDEILCPYLEKPLLQILYPQSSGIDDLDETTYSRLAFFAIEYALAELWKSWGIEPNVVMGYDVGEYVAACVAGVFSLEDAIKLVAGEIKASEVTYFSPNISIISSITGKLASGELIATADYWQNHFEKTIDFDASIQTLYKQGYNLFVEIGPDHTLIDRVKPYLPEDFGTWLPSLQKTQPDWQILLSSLARLYQLGINIDWSGFDRDYQRYRIPLPTYPFQRQRYWIESSKNQSRAGLAIDISHPLLHKRLHSPLEQIQFESEFILKKLPLVTDHRMNGIPVVNMALYLEMICVAAREAFGNSYYHLHEFSISQGIIMPEVGSRIVHLIITPESEQIAAFKMFSLPADDAESKSWTEHVSGKLILQDEQKSKKVKPPVDIAKLQTQYSDKILGSELYQMMEERGAKLGQSCQRLQGEVWRKDGEAIAKIGSLGNIDSDKDYVLPLGSVDAWTQILAACFSDQLPYMYLLSGFEDFLFYGYSGKQLWGQAQINFDENQENYRETILGNLCLFDETGEVVAEITNAELKHVSFEALQRVQEASNRTSKPRRSSSISPKKVFATASQERLHLLEKYLIDELAIALQLNPIQLNSQQLLATIIDSLMAFELRKSIETDLKIKLPIEEFLGENNITKLATTILEKLNLTNLTFSEFSSTEINENMEEIIL